MPEWYCPVKYKQITIMLEALEKIRDHSCNMGSECGDPVIHKITTDTLAEIEAVVQ